MPNGNKNNNKKEIELLPVELRRTEEKRRDEERPEVKLFIPPEERKPERPSFTGRVSIPQTPKEPREDFSVFKMQKEEPHPAPAPAPRPVQRPAPQPRPAPSRPPEKSKQPSLTKPSGPKQPIGSKIGITLMPEETAETKKNKGQGKKVALLIVIAVLLASIAGGAYAAVKWYEGQVDLELQKVSTDLLVVNRQIENLGVEKTDAQILQRRLKAASALLDQHVYWTNFFSFLEKNIVSDVYFVSMIGASDGQVTLAGVAKSYKALARQINAFRANNSVGVVSVLSASASVDADGNVVEVDFDAKLTLKPEIFLK